MDDQNLSLDQILDLNLVKKTFTDAGVDPGYIEQNIEEIIKDILARLFILMYQHLSPSHQQQLGIPDVSTPEKSETFILNTLQLIESDESISFDPNPLTEQAITQSVNHYRQIL